MYLLALLRLFTDQNDIIFPTVSCTSAGELPNLSYTRTLKKVPLSGGAYPYRPLYDVCPR